MLHNVHDKNKSLWQEPATPKHSAPVHHPESTAHQPAASGPTESAHAAAAMSHYAEDKQPAAPKAAAPEAAHGAELRSAGASTGNAITYKAHDTTTVRTHAMGLVRETMHAGELFTGTNQGGGWVYGESASKVKGWALLSSLTPYHEDHKVENPAGKAHEVGRPDRKDYVNGQDMKNAKAEEKKTGEPSHFHYSTSCTAKTAASVFTDIGLTQHYKDGTEPKMLKAGHAVSVRYLSENKQVACIFMDGNWYFTHASALNLDNLNDRLDDLHNR